MILYQGLPILTHCYREFVILPQRTAYGSDTTFERREARERALRVRPPLLL